MTSIPPKIFILLKKRRRDDPQIVEINYNVTSFSKAFRKEMLRFDRYPKTPKNPQRDWSEFTESLRLAIEENLSNKSYTNSKISISVTVTIDHGCIIFFFSLKPT